MGMAEIETLLLSMQPPTTPYSGSRCGSTRILLDPLVAPSNQARNHRRPQADLRQGHHHCPAFIVDPLSIAPSAAWPRPTSRKRLCREARLLLRGLLLISVLPRSFAHARFLHSLLLLRNRKPATSLVCRDIRFVTFSFVETFSGQMKGTVAVSALAAVILSTVGQAAAKGSFSLDSDGEDAPTRTRLPLRDGF